MKLELKNSMQKSVITGVMAALLAVLSLISIPLPIGVPITLQTFGVALCGFMLGPAMGTAAVGVYLAMGAVGIPVFAGFSSGFGSFLGVTGGFLWGFLPMAFLCGLGIWLGKKLYVVPLGLLGLAVCHLFGAAQYAMLSATPFWQALLAVSVPFLVKDAISVIMAYLMALAIIVSLKKAGFGGEA